MYNFDVIVVGAGPAGIVASMLLGRSGLRVALVEKNRFPRSKTCGDGITPDIIRQLALVDEALQQKVVRLPGFTPYSSLVLKAPNGREVEVGIPSSGGLPGMAGCRRDEFDQALLGHLIEQGSVEVFEGCRVNGINVAGSGVELETGLGPMRSRMVIGADGSNSVVASLVTRPELPGSDAAFAVRGYFRLPEADAEKVNNPCVIFHRRLLPGYLWMFPFADSTANIGLGMSVKAMKKGGINLHHLLFEMLDEPSLRRVWGKAVPEGKVKGHFIPLGRKGRSISAPRILLAGDAAGLAHPLTGEGIGNAIRSGRLAAWHTLNCFNDNRFDASFNKAYDREVYRRTALEFSNFRQMQYLFRFQPMLNLLAGLASPGLIRSLTNPEIIGRMQTRGFLPWDLLVRIIRDS